MLSAQHTSTEVQPAADHALPYILYAEGRLGKPNFIHYQSQPSRSTKKFKRAKSNKVRFGQTTTVIDDRVILIGGCESTEGVLPSNLLVLNSTTLDVNEQNAKLPVSGHGAAPIRGSRILITFGIQTMAPQRTFATPIQEIDVNTMDVISSSQFEGEVPQQRYDHTTTKIDDRIYIYGGKNKDDDILGDMFYIDLNLNSWNLIEQPLYPIAGHSSILVNNYLISCFGIGVNAKIINDCNVFDISINTFIQSKINEEPPKPRTLSSMVSSEDNKNTVYIFGGIDENGNGLNDLYKLDASKIPTLSWSPVNINAKTTNDKLIPSGRGAHSAFTIGNTNIMTIWGGRSKENQLADSNFYFFDIKGNTWVDENYYKKQITPEQKSTEVVAIVGIIGIVVLVLGFVSFLIIHKRKALQKFKTREINNDPYNRPGDQFGSNIYLINNFESKQIQFKVMDELESVPEPTPQPASTLPSLPTKVEKESKTSNNCQPNDPISSTTLPKRMSFGKLENTSLTNTGSESQRMKRTHRRTSSVSLTSSELANIARTRNFTRHKSSLSTNSITSSPLSNSHQNSRRSNNPRNSGRSVNSIQWVGFDSSMIDDQEENRNVLHVRNLSPKQKNFIEEDDEYTINGDYIDTSEVKNNYNRDIFDHDEVITTYDVKQRKNPQNYSANDSVILKQDITEEYATSNESSDVNTIRESGVIDKFAHESPSSSNELSEEDKGSSMKTSKRSSKRISRVSFALKDEKIEFDENESSSTVSLARMSGRSLSSQSSTSSSATPSIIEEEEEEEEEEDSEIEDYFALRNSTTFNPILSKSLLLFDESSLSRFSF